VSELFDFSEHDLAPTAREVLSAQGVPKTVDVSEQAYLCTESAIDLFRELAAPAGVVLEADDAGFSRVFQGENNNAPDSVVHRIRPSSEGLALFAATVGKPLSERIGQLFEDADFALGVALDAVASLAAQRTSELLADDFLYTLCARRAANHESHVLGYSPGYCGWHISGQRALFEAVRPERIGMTLNERYMMTPMKSVSGVLVAGPTHVHDFLPRFSYCPKCRAHSCQARIKQLHSLDEERVGTP
jgi:cobalamin-dependent methionine synthase-like protein